MTTPDQYPPNLSRVVANLPPSVVDVDGEVWWWTDADGQGRPGYQRVEGFTADSTPVIGGPAYSREYVTESRWCVRPDCRKHHGAAS